MRVRVKAGLEMRVHLLLAVGTLAARSGDAAMAQAVVGGLEATDAAHGRGQPDAATHVGTDAQGRAAGGDERA